METTANPYVLSMGPAETATRRLNLAQSFNPMGSLMGMLAAQILVIKSLQSDNIFGENIVGPGGDIIHQKGDLIYDTLPAIEQAAIRTNDLGIISGPYIGLGILVLVILVIMAVSKMPGKKDKTNLPIGKTFSQLFKNKRYREGVITQAFYVGAQIMCWTFIYQYVDNINIGRPESEHLTATWYNMAAMLAFLSGRWMSTLLLKFLNPARLMYFFALGAIIMTIGTIFIPGVPGLYCLVGISVFMSLMFPTIYGIALRDMGDEAKIGSAGLVMAIVGGALMPPLQGRILDFGGDGFADVQLFGYIPEVAFSFALPLICLIVVAIYSWRSFKIHLNQ